MDYDKLNPGIRNLVALLRYHGFETVDSEDGETHEFECDREEKPYVSILLKDPKEMATESQRLLALLKQVLEIGPVAVGYEGGFNIQGSYDPMNGICVLDVVGAADRHLKPRYQQLNTAEAGLAMADLDELRRLESALETAEDQRWAFVNVATADLRLLLRTVCRGEGHGSPNMTGSCIISAVADLKETIQEQAAELTNVSERLGKARNIGDQMSNVCYNLAQQRDRSDHEKAMFEELYKKWDTLVREVL